MQSKLRLIGNQLSVSDSVFHLHYVIMLGTDKSTYSHLDVVPQVEERYTSLKY